MKKIMLNSWDDFLNKMINIRKRLNIIESTRGDFIDRILFRGQSNSDWNLQSTIERNEWRGSQNRIDLYNYYSYVYQFKQRVETMLNKKWDIPSPSDYKEFLNQNKLTIDSEIPGYDYITFLRHYGFPTPIIDWSRSPFIAAFFAFENRNSMGETVSIYMLIKWRKYIESNNSPFINIQVRQSYGNERHFLQQSAYTACIRKVNQQFIYADYDELIQGENNEIIHFVIPAKERKKALFFLDSCNINSYSLYQNEESFLRTLNLREILSANPRRLEKELAVSGKQKMELLFDLMNQDHYGQQSQ
jgi:hypothetical protein